MASRWRCATPCCREMPNAPSERRLHPVSFLFRMASHVRQLIVPGLFVLFAGARGGDGWQLWAMLFMVPVALVAIAQTLVFRYRIDPDGLRIQSGLLFRQQRHVPYERIQNIDAVQNVVHRAFGVVDVRLETAGGHEPEAHLRVVSTAAFEELRAQVQAGRAGLAATADRRDMEEGPADAAEQAETLLRLPAGELVVCGLIQGRGLIVLGALFGLLWEAGMMDRLTAAIFGEGVAGRGVLREFVRSMLQQGAAAPAGIAMTAGAIGAFLIVTRVVSVGWALVRLHGFHLQRIGDDLRADFGLFTRVAATIPIRRIQTVTVHEGPLHRLFGRVSIRVETAGGDADQAVQLQRQWLAPVVPPADVPHLLARILPSVDARDVTWQPVERRGIRRVRLRWLVKAAALALVAWPLAGSATTLVFLFVALAGEVDARRSVPALGWALTSSGVLFRSGWLWRQQTIAPFAKIQAVVVRASPFDRRLDMARVEVDTAGMSQTGHRIDVPYLARATAEALGTTLAAQAARTTFRW
jgi:putative membrane protein